MVSDKILGSILSLIALLIIGSETYGLIIMPILDTTLIPAQFYIQYIALAAPVYIGVLGISLIVLWIGITMITTPPPQEFDFEEFEEEIKKEENA